MGLRTWANSQRYLLGIWIAMGVLTPLLGFLAPRGFAAFVGLMGLLCLPLVRPAKTDWMGVALLAVLAVWAGASMAWSPAPNLVVHSAKDVERLTPLHLAYQLLLSGAFVIAAGRLEPEAARKALRWQGWGLLALAGILVVEGLTQAGLYQHLQGIVTKKVPPDLAVRNVAVGGYVMAALIWPAGVALYRWRGWAPAAALGAAVLISTVLLRGDSPTLAMLIAGAAFAAVLKFGRPAILALATLSTTYWLWTPVLVVALQKIGVWGRVYGHLPMSWNRRMEIWSFTDQKIFQDPFVGWGIDASRTFKGYIQLHPHDGALQAWFELGLPGAALIAAFFLYLFWRISEAVQERLFAAAACATAVVYLVIGAISFSLWQEWWICLGALGMASAVVLRRALEPQA